MKIKPYFIILLLLPFVNSIEYYVDEQITIQDNGESLIEGQTNIDMLADLHPINEKIAGVTQELTSKKGKYWLFSYNSNINVTAVYIKINLPKGAVVNLIKSAMPVNIETTNNIITLKFFGEGEPFNILLQYSLNKESNLTMLWVLFAGLLVLVGLAIYKKIPKKAVKIAQDRLSELKPTLNESQVKIIDALLEKKGEASQTAIKYMTGLPKSSLSRNVELLAQKEIIQKFFNGTTNFLKIHPKYRK